MERVEIGPEGTIIIEGAAGTYTDSTRALALDGMPGVPVVSGLVYRRGVLQARLIDGGQVADDTPPETWDALIDGLPALLAAQAARKGGSMAPVTDPDRAIKDALTEIDRRSVRALREAVAEVVRVLRIVAPSEPMTIPAQLGEFDAMAETERGKLRAPGG